MSADAPSRETAFEVLLSGLRADSPAPSAGYRALRQRLVGYFEWRDVDDPDELADETLDRVIARIEQGEQVQSIAAYAFGVARLVLLEWQRGRAVFVSGRSSMFQSTDDEDFPPAPSVTEALDVIGDRAEHEARLVRLEQCLERLAPNERQVVLDYYADHSSGRIAQRRDLIKTLRTSANNLRVKVFRIRAKIEACMLQALREAARELERGTPE